jgi:hypothetical protein
MNKFQNRSARVISNVLPGGSVVLTPDRAERMRASAAHRAGEMVELGSESAPEQPMPKPRIPDITKAKEKEALLLIRDETSVAILKQWWEAEGAVSKPRERVLDEIRLRAAALKPKDPAA